MRINAGSTGGMKPKTIDRTLEIDKALNDAMPPLTVITSSVFDSSYRVYRVHSSTENQSHLVNHARAGHIFAEVRLVQSSCDTLYASGANYCQ
jgi:hypothetical protein